MTARTNTDEGVQMIAMTWKLSMVTAGIAVAVGAGGLLLLPPIAGAAGKHSKPVRAVAAARVGTGIPKSAFSTHTGITANTVSVANIATHFGTLFTGAAVGTEAYADYVNSKGGVNGRKIEVTVENTGYSGTTDAKLTESAISKNFALVGGFSVLATSAGQVLAKSPGMPDVSVTVSPANNRLANLVSPAPLEGGWQEGTLLYLKSQDPKAVTKAAAMVADQPSAVDAWDGEEAAMEHVGYKITYENTFAISAKYSTFVTDVIAMKSKGVKMLFVSQNPPLYAAPLIKALTSQHFHPVVVLGASTYSDTLIPTSGGAKAVDGMYLAQNISLYLGQDQKTIPAVATFLHWVGVADPSWKPDLFTLYGWLSAELFADGLQHAGKDPSRGSLLQALGKISNFSGTYIEAPVDPAAKTVSNCYLIARIKNGKWVRQADPPVNSKTHGYRCTNQYYVPPGTGY